MSQVQNYEYRIICNIHHMMYNISYNVLLCGSGHSSLIHLWVGVYEGLQLREINSVYFCKFLVSGTSPLMEVILKRMSGVRDNFICSPLGSADIYSKLVREGRSQGD